VAESDKGKDYSMFFDITTTDRILHFKADSVPSAREWVKALNKIIFRSHNDGDGVKIVLPIESIFGLEESPVLEFADTFKLDVLDQIDHTTDEVSRFIESIVEHMLKDSSIFSPFSALERKHLNFSNDSLKNQPPMASGNRKLRLLPLHLRCY